MTVVLAPTGPIPASVVVSAFRAPASTSTKATNRKLTWPQLVAILTKHERRADKDGAGWSPAVYVPGSTRGNASVIEVSCLVGDIDHADFDDYTAIRGHLSELGLEHVIHSTFNNASPDDLRFRIVIPLTRPIPRDDWLDFWRRACVHVFRERNDAQAKDPARFYYTPAAPADTLVIAEHHEGLALDPGLLPAAPRAATLNGHLHANGHSPRLPGGTNPIGEVIAGGTRNARLTSLAGTMRRVGLTENEMVAALLEVNARCDPPLDEAEVRGIAASVARYQPAPDDQQRRPSDDRRFRPQNDSSAFMDEVLQETILTFRSARQLAAETPAETKWIVSGLVAPGATTEIDAKVKAGKTTLVLAMCKQILGGEPFLGLATRKTGIVYLTEQSATSFRAALKRAGLEDADDLVILQWHQARGVPWPEVVRQAAAKARKLGYEVLIVDTLSPFAGIAGDAENTAGAALEAMVPLQEVVSRDNLGVMVVRHERKAGGEVGDSARGSSAFTGAADIVVALRRGDGAGSDNVRVLRTLSRFDETPADLYIAYQDGGYRAVGTEHEYKAQEARRKVTEELPTDEAGAAEVKNLCEQVDMGRSTVQKVLDALVAEGAACTRGAGKKNDPRLYWRNAPLPTSPSPSPKSFPTEPHI